jgi:hypothetical protein
MTSQSRSSQVRTGTRYPFHTKITTLLADPGLTVHHGLTRIIMELADGHGIDPDRLSFTKVLKHVRRSVVRQCADTTAKIGKFLATLASKVHRKLDNGVRCLREAARQLKRPESQYSYRGKVQQRGPTSKLTPRPSPSTQQ